MDNMLKWIEGHQGSAAWVQAVFSVLAILAAAFIPMWHDHRKTEAAKKAWISSLANLAKEVDEMADDVSTTYASDSGLLSACFDGDPDEYAPLIQALAAFPLPSHVNRDHLTKLLRLKGLATSWQWKWVAAVRNGEAMVRDANYDEDKLATRLEWLRKSTKDLVGQISVA